MTPTISLLLPTSSEHISSDRLYQQAQLEFSQWLQSRLYSYPVSYRLLGYQGQFYCHCTIRINRADTGFLSEFALTWPSTNNRYLINQEFIR